LNILINVFPDGIRIFVYLVHSVMGILSLGYYFKALGISVLWAVLLFGAKAETGYDENQVYTAQSSMLHIRLLY